MIFDNFCREINAEMFYLSTKIIELTLKLVNIIDIQLGISNFSVSSSISANLLLIDFWLSNTFDKNYIGNQFT